MGGKARGGRSREPEHLPRRDVREAGRGARAGGGVREQGCDSCCRLSKASARGAGIRKPEGIQARIPSLEFFKTLLWEEREFRQSTIPCSM